MEICGDVNSKHIFNTNRHYMQGLIGKKSNNQGSGVSEREF